MQPTLANLSFPRDFDPGAVCPSCHGSGLQTFYRVDRIPVHSTLLMATRAEALDYPSGDLELAHCRACGFVTNKRFDPSVHEYSQRCEESQAFSGTFNAFARALAQRLIDRYDIHRKTVLEIGCGKADFLALLCTLAENRGIGIDPSAIAERIPEALRDRIRVIGELYSPAHAGLAADFVCCRHTLEHIGPVGQFVDLMAANIGGQPSPVFFEVPDALRVLREGAFWDVYYEHCSYFSCGSLARLFRSRGFSLDLLEVDYDDQYVLLGSVPPADAREQQFEIEHDLDVLHNGVESFGARTWRAVTRWRDMIGQAAQRGERTVVWGSSSKGVSFLTTLGVDREIEYVVDINSYRQGKFMPGTGQEIVAPDFLRDYRPDHVIVMNPVYVDEIAADLQRMGLDAQLHTV